MRVYVDSEVGRLHDVLLGSIENFVLHQPINNTQRYYYDTDPPRLDLLVEQQIAFIEVLEKYDVRIHWVESRQDSPLQFYTRDVATVIGNSLIVCSMKEPVRQHEPEALGDLIAKLETPPIHVDAGFIEGGDIILDRDILYVGLGERTNPSGLEWLKEEFGGRFEIRAVQLQPPFLHLDVVFNLLGDRIGLVYPAALQESSLEALKKHYKLIEVTNDEQFDLATNVLSLSPNTVISDKRYIRINAILQELGQEVIQLDFSEISKLGGLFRCGTCPLVRESI